MNFEIKEDGKFRYVETGGSRENLLLLHGLFGALSNFEGILERFKDEYNVLFPFLPIFEMPIRKVSVSGLVDHVASFVEHKQIDQVHALGNSLGGHIAQLYALRYPEKVKSMILTGSSGLFESGMGNSFPKRGDYDYIREGTEKTFYDPKVATKALVDEVYDIVNDRNKAIRIVLTAKSALRHNLGEKLHQIKAPTLLVWGLQDTITPPFVGEKFNELIDDSKLVFIDKCGHAPMMERPEEFNHELSTFLREVIEREVNA